MRKTIFANGEFYHIYNRGVDKRDVFLCEMDYRRFLTEMREFNTVDPTGGLYVQNLRKKSVYSNQVTKPSDLVTVSSQLVDIIAYCLNPNHYHMILKQNMDNGISKFMKRVGGGYSRYFNEKYDRSGALFQGPFKSIHIDSNAYLLYLSAYVNHNHFIHGCGTDDWPYASYLDYIGKRNGDLCAKDVVLLQFGNMKEYHKFIKSNALYLKNKKELEKYILE